MSGKFQRRKEDFNCLNCGAQVKGNGFTDHCPKCLYSKHVDVNPGDRENKCHGILKPIDIAPHKEGYKIFYKCLKCGYKHHNKSAPDDEITDFIKNLNSQ